MMFSVLYLHNASSVSFNIDDLLQVIRCCIRVTRHTARTRRRVYHISPMKSCATEEFPQGDEDEVVVGERGAVVDAPRGERGEALQADRIRFTANRTAARIASTPFVVSVCANPVRFASTASRDTP